MNEIAKGSFTVAMQPAAEPNSLEGVSLGRMALSKQFSGDLVGTGQGEMLTALTQITGSAGYVAIERVSGVLHGRQGTFVLQHNGLMHAGEQRLSIKIVPSSGTGELLGIAGHFKLEMVDGQHQYELSYTLP